jgi:multidrug efflux system outer membrane protein
MTDPRRRDARCSAIALMAALLAACAGISPSSERPQLDLPALSAPAPTGLDRWWTAFGDPQLDALVTEALGRNLDLRVAAARVDEARGAVRLARSSLVPAVDLQEQSSRSRRSSAVALAFPGPPITNDHLLQLQTSFELDVWGRLRSARDAAAADLLASRYAAETVHSAVAAQVASTWFTLHALDAELALTRETLGTRDETVQLQQQRVDAGLNGDYELRLAEAERAALAAAVPGLQQAIARNEAALAALAGRSPRAVFTPEITRGLPLAPDLAAPVPDVPAGLTSDLLARRPDIRQAEANLVAADARIAQARAQYYPKLQLTAAFGGESEALSDLFTAPARLWSVAGGVLLPLLGRDRIGADVDQATARRQQAALAWQQAVQATLRDVHDALAAHQAAVDTYVAQDARRAKVVEALKLVDMRWRGGYSNFLEVLDAQRSLLEADRGRLNALRDRRLALIDLYKALGGGWESAAPPAGS